MFISLKKVLFAAFLFSINYSYSQIENKKIDSLIQQKRIFNQQNKNSTVYKIQLYYGNETEAYKIKQNFETLFPEYKTIIDASKQPDWKTQVGNFNTRLEADRVLNIIKVKFFGAIVLEDKI